MPRKNSTAAFAEEEDRICIEYLTEGENLKTYFACNKFSTWNIHLHALYERLAARGYLRSKQTINDRLVEMRKEYQKVILKLFSGSSDQITKLDRVALFQAAASEFYLFHEWDIMTKKMLRDHQPWPLHTQQDYGSDLPCSIGPPMAEPSAPAATGPTPDTTPKTSALLLPATDETIHEGNSEIHKDSSIMRPQNATLSENTLHVSSEVPQKKQSSGWSAVNVTKRQKLVSPNGGMPTNVNTSTSPSQPIAAVGPSAVANDKHLEEVRLNPQITNGTCSGGKEFTTPTVGQNYGFKIVPSNRGSKILVSPPPFTSLGSMSKDEYETWMKCQHLEFDKWYAGQLRRLESEYRKVKEVEKLVADLERKTVEAEAKVQRQLAFVNKLVDLRSNSEASGMLLDLYHALA
jgi:hypothetical protein